MEGRTDVKVSTQKAKRFIYLRAGIIYMFFFNFVWLLDQHIWLLLVTRVDDHRGCSRIWSDFYFEGKTLFYTLHFSGWKAFSHFPSHIASLSKSCGKYCVYLVDFIGMYAMVSSASSRIVGFKPTGISFI